MSISLIRAAPEQKWHVGQLDLSTSLTRSGDYFVTQCGRYLKCVEIQTVDSLSHEGVCGQCRCRRKVKEREGQP